MQRALLFAIFCLAGVIVAACSGNSVSTTPLQHASASPTPIVNSVSSTAVTQLLPANGTTTIPLPSAATGPSGSFVLTTTNAPAGAAVSITAMTATQPLAGRRRPSATQACGGATPVLTYALNFYPKTYDVTSNLQSVTISKLPQNIALNTVDLQIIDESGIVTLDVGPVAPFSTTATSATYTNRTVVNGIAFDSLWQTGNLAALNETGGIPPANWLDSYVMNFYTCPSVSPSPSASPSAAPSASPTATASPQPPQTVAAATGSLTIANGSGNVFPGSPPANVAAFSPSLFFNGSVVVSGVASMNVPYTEWLGIPLHGCPVSGGVAYALELTPPNAFTFTASTPGSGFMDLMLTASGSYTGSIFDEANCSTPLAGPGALVAGGGGVVEYTGGGTLTIPAGHTIIEEIAH